MGALILFIEEEKVVLRTHTCGELRLEHVGQEVVLSGWVNRRRDHGGLVFIDLRDRYGLTQVVFDPSTSPTAHRIAEQLRNEYVVQVRGRVRPRPAGLQNPNLATGDIEVVALEARILNESKTPVFDINKDGDVDETLRLRYRYLDLRRPRMLRNLQVRHQVVYAIRQYLHERGFIDVETPILIKSTPEGARDYLVPSRLHPGRFYALPQSPQQLKQLLMVSGVDRYFQIARCFRDEDLRADRQPEFTQLDLEMSFVERDDVLQLIEGLLIHVISLFPEKRIQTIPFPRLTYAEAMERYGSDKPDLRFGLPLVDIADCVRDSEFRVFAETLTGGGRVKALRLPGCAGYTRREIDELTELARGFGAKGLFTFALREGEVRSPIAKYLSPAQLETIVARTEAQEGDLIVGVADSDRVVAESLGRLRLEMGHRLGLTDDNVLACAWITEFPLLDWNEEEKRYQAVHHPFTSAMPEDLPFLETDPGRVRAQAYDVVINGWEIGGGSIRIHDRATQSRMFAALGMSEEEAEAQFGHLLNAFQYGAPPHGGIALGIDRLVMIIAGETSIREVIAFPKTNRAQDLMTDAPSPASDGQLRDLHLQVTHVDGDRP